METRRFATLADVVSFMERVVPAELIWSEEDDSCEETSSLSDEYLPSWYHTNTSKDATRYTLVSGTGNSRITS
jgi:hypothetical protein